MQLQLLLKIESAARLQNQLYHLQNIVQNEVQQKNF